MTQPITEPTEDRPYVRGHEIVTGTWLNDPTLADHPLHVDHITPVFEVPDLHGTHPQSRKQRIMIAEVYGVPTDYRLIAADAVYLATDDEIAAHKARIGREQMARDLRKLADLILDTRLPIQHELLHFNAGYNVDRVDLHHIAGIIGAEVAKDYVSKSDGKTHFRVTAGSRGENGASIDWAGAWAVEPTPAEVAQTLVAD